jgi:BirA family biotin operon repressor/biotin-[acetyl-CoA-carboxylase] ligase
MSGSVAPDFATTLRTKLQTKILGYPCHYFSTIDSTNVYAAKITREGATEGTIVIADAQSGGKGRLGRSWISPPGVNLYLSVILRPSVSVSIAPQLNLLAAVAVADAIAEVCQLTPTIKWPNDVLLTGKKVCGILAEMQTEGGELQAVILGIGVNINAPRSAFPEELQEKASSLLLVSGRTIERSTFTASLLTHLEKYYVLWLEQGFPVLRTNWEHHASAVLGRYIAVAVPEGTVTGIALGLDADGALLVRGEADGVVHRLLAGDVSVIGGYDRGEKNDPRR